ncbi:MAG: putative outer membrane protein, involved in nutrient binding [Bacteroidetes bacterium]|nr:putative outer membrane protein, involved in nutrient binding [Bacteroidota bacterium]
MKNKFSIIYALALMMCCSSCSDFLEETNKNTVTVDNGYYDTEEGMESIINSCYTPMRFWAGKTLGIAMSESGTDIMANAGCDFPAMANYQNGLDGTDPVCSTLYEKIYLAINYCNVAIEHIDNVPASETIKSKRMAEARFLRAYYYWILVENFGDIYYTDKSTDVVITNPTKTKVADVYTNIFADLDFAINSQLSENQGDGGRITKWAAKAFKARLLLTRASELNDTNYYEQAYTLAKEIIDNGPFSLNKNFASVFDMANSDGTGNKEVIWYVDYSSTNQLYNMELDDYTIRTGGNHAHMIFCMKYDDQPGMTRSIEYGRPFAHYMPTLFLLDLYDTENDQRYEGTFRSLWKANGGKTGAYTLMQQGDTAIWATRDVVSADKRAWAQKRYQILDRYTIYNEDGSVKNHKQYLQIKKFEDPKRETVKEDRSSRDAFLIRLAEMYMIVAEAGAKCSKPDALSYMNTLRTTRAKTGHEEAMKVTLSDISDINFILDERARELVGEQIRWFDLKRAGETIFLERIRKGNPDAAGVQAYHMLRPFPQQFLDAITNKDEFTQNPMYD